MRLKSLLTALLMFVAAAASAAARTDLVVEGVQMPAWVEYANGSRDPLAIGMALNNKDKIYTGPGSRALLRLADGSLIKLGENGVLALDDLGRKRVSAKDVVTASLDVVSGAFRFTTQALYKFRGERDVKVRIVTVTAGIRGTDLWGKADATRDIVCLIEGKITVARGQDAFTMDQPMSFYIAPKNEPPLPVARVSRQQLDEWATETEIGAGMGALRKGGAWKVYVAEASTQEQALTVYDALRKGGYAAEIRPARSGAGQVYRVRLSNLPNRKEAEALAARLKGNMGVAAPKVSR
jgi:hypothetical protein